MEGGWESLGGRMGRAAEGGWGELLREDGERATEGGWESHGGRIGKAAEGGCVRARDTVRAQAG